MAEGKTNMFGKTYNTIGSTDSNFIIKTKGDLKIQWGGKYIDLIKNGKVVSNNASILSEVSSSDDILSDGIYLVTSEENSEVWISVNGTKIQLNSLTDETTYVSFMVELETDSTQKQLALTNIGFYYDTLDDLRTAKVVSGIFYVLGDSKLYIAKNGVVSEYITTTSANKSEEPLYIKDYSLTADGVEYITCNNRVYILKELEVHNGIYSNGATESKGFRLYVDSNGKSIIDVDIVNERNYSLDDIVNIYSEHTNYILSSSISRSEDETATVEYYLKYPNRFVENDTILTLLENTLNDSYDEDTLVLTLTLSEPSITDVYINVILDSGITTHTFPSNTTELIIEGVLGTYLLQYTLNSVIKEYKIILSHGQYIKLNSNVSLYGYIYKSNAPLIKIENNDMIVTDRSVLINSVDSEGVPILIPDETIHTLIGPILEDLITNINTCPSTEEEILALQEYENNIKVGIYSDNFIGVNSKLYNPIFKKRCDGLYPRYDESLTVPEEDKLNEKYDQVVPNIRWIKELLSMAVPVGTIIMWSGTEVPEGWAICDGNNGTPNLIGKFIKAGTTAGVTGGGGNHTIENNNNYIKLSVENLPNHTHTIPELTTTSNGSHAHEYSDEYTDWASGTDNTYDVNYIETTGENTLSSIGLKATNYSVNEGDFDRTTESDGSHTHTVPATSTSGTTDANSTPFSIEPSYFSLIFIMKLPLNNL